MSRNACYTYFKITGDFEPDDITELLRVLPEQQWRIGDKRKNGTVYDFALWEFGRCDTYDIAVENQMLHTIECLLSKVKLLQDLKQNYDVSYTLQIMPSIYAEETTPCLAPSKQIIKLCCVTDTEIDIDLYVYNAMDDKNVSRETFL